MEPDFLVAVGDVEVKLMEERGWNRSGTIGVSMSRARPSRAKVAQGWLGDPP